MKARRHHFFKLAAGGVKEGHAGLGQHMHALVKAGSTYTTANASKSTTCTTDCTYILKKVYIIKMRNILLGYSSLCRNLLKS